MREVDVVVSAYNNIATASRKTPARTNRDVVGQHVAQETRRPGSSRRSLRTCRPDWTLDTLRPLDALRACWSRVTPHSLRPRCAHRSYRSLDAGCARGSGIALWSLDALRSLNALRASRSCVTPNTLRALRSSVALQPLHTLNALWTSRALNTLYTLRSGVTAHALRPLRSSQTLRADVALRSLYALRASRPCITLRSLNTLRSS